jgi:hypothetical protein
VPVSPSMLQFQVAPRRCMGGWFARCVTHARRSSRLAIGFAKATSGELQSPLRTRAGGQAPSLPSPTHCRGSFYLSLTSALETERLPAGLPTGRGQPGGFIAIIDRDIGLRILAPLVGLGRGGPRICPGSYPSSCHNRRPRRLMSGSRSRRTSARQLRARLRVTFSWLRSFLIVDGNGRSFPEA